MRFNGGFYKRHNVSCITFVFLSLLYRVMCCAAQTVPCILSLVSGVKVSSKRVRPAVRTAAVTVFSRVGEPIPRRGDTMRGCVHCALIVRFERYGKAPT